MNAETDALREARRRLLRFSWVVAGTLALGTAGYWLTMDVSLSRGAYLTIETLAYLGKQQKEGNALFVQLALLHVGTLVTWYGGWLFVDLMMEHHFVRHFREMRRMKKLETMSDHAVICGGGRVGVRLAEVLAAKKQPVVIVEVDADITEALRARAADHGASAEARWFVVTGDARDEDTLRTAGVDRARTLFAVLPEADKNAMVTLTALALKETLDVHARCERPDYAAKLARAGARHVVVPQVACADQMAEAAFAAVADVSAERLKVG